MRQSGLCCSWNLEKLEVRVQSGCVFSWNYSVHLAIRKVSFFRKNASGNPFREQRVQNKVSWEALRKYLQGSSIICVEVHWTESCAATHSARGSTAPVIFVSSGADWTCGDFRLRASKDAWNHADPAAHPRTRPQRREEVRHQIVSTSPELQKGASEERLFWIVLGIWSSEWHWRVEKPSTEGSLVPFDKARRAPGSGRGNEIQKLVCKSGKYAG